jgi:hypothetical protein
VPDTGVRPVDGALAGRFGRYYLRRMRTNRAPRWVDPVIEAYKEHVDDSLLRAQLRRTPTERVLAIMEMQKLIEEMRRAQRSSREKR